MTSPREKAEEQGRIWVPRLLDGLLVLPIQIAAVAYLAWVARPSLAETSLLLALFLSAAALAPWWSNRRRDGVFAIARGTAPDEAATDRARLVLRAAESEARRRAWTAGLVGLFPIVSVPLASWAFGLGAWTEPVLFRSLLVMAGFASVAAATTVFCWTRQRLAWLDERAVAPPSDGADEATPVSASAPSSSGGRSAGTSLSPSSGGHSAGTSLISSFESLSVLVSAAACLMILLDASSHDARRTAEAAAIAWAEGALAAVAVVPRVETETLDDRVRAALPEPRLRPASTRVYESDVAGRLPAIPQDAFGRALAKARRENPGVGRVRPPSGDAVGAYQRQADGRVLVVRLARAELAAAGVGWNVGVVGFLLFTALLLLGSFAASDRRVQVEVLESRLHRLAKGDLRARLRERSSSEFASLDPLLLRIRERMRRAVLNSRVATEEVDLTVGAVADALAQVETTSLAQAAQMSEARELLSAVLDRFGAARRSTDELTEAIDESSHSVHELGAAGEELKETASVLTSRVEVVSDSLEQMVASVKQVGATSEQLAEASEETSSSMEEMASAMRAVDTSAETTANLSRDVVEKAELGQAKVVQTIAGMEAIRDATDVAERVIRGLGARTSEIGGILDVIEDVADETNLLALNAAIIAAQAGEQGKAFSVVADEIKELADRVLASTKEIADLIRAVQNESENAIGAIEAGSVSVMSGVDLSAEAGRTLEEITDASRESGTRISEIVNSVREQTKAASHVVSLMERVRDSADQIGAAGAEQDRGNEVVYRSALTMREVAQQVHRTTEDQAAGFGRIRANVEGVRGAVDEITEAMQAQLEACGVMSGVLERAAEGSRSNEGVAEGLREALTALSARTARCKEDVEEYRL